VATSTLSGVLVREARPEEILLARRFHAKRYLAEGYVDVISANGTIDDRYVAHSTYYIAQHEITGEMVGICRIIDSDTHSFPMLDHMQLDAEWRRRLLDTPSREIGEVSALVTARGELAHYAISAALCREAFRRSLTDTPRRYLLCIVDRVFLRVLNGVFRAGLTEAGPAQEYLGRTVPTVVPIEDVVIDLRDRTDAFGDYFREDLDIDAMADAIIDLRGGRAEVVAPAGLADTAGRNRRSPG
jgi:hypothetical protein